MSNKFTAVIFDMGGVLVSGPTEIWSQIEDEQCLDRGSLKQAMFHLDFNDDFENVQTGKTCTEEFEEVYSKFYASQHPTKQISSLPVLSMYEKRMKKREDMIEAVRIIRSKGIKTALLTNNVFMDKNHERSLLGVETNIFDVVVESCRVGLCKPHPDIYKLTLQRLSCNSEDVLFLDDFEENIQGARILGIKTIQVDSSKQALSDLENILAFPMR